MPSFTATKTHLCTTLAHRFILAAAWLADGVLAVRSRAPL